MSKHNKWKLATQPSTGNCQCHALGFCFLSDPENPEHLRQPLPSWKILVGYWMLKSTGSYVKKVGSVHVGRPGSRRTVGFEFPISSKECPTERASYGRIAYRVVCSRNGRIRQQRRFEAYFAPSSENTATFLGITQTFVGSYRSFPPYYGTGLQLGCVWRKIWNLSNKVQTSPYPPSS